MHRIDHPTAVAALPAPGAPGTPGYFTEGDPVGGVAATVVTQAWANAVQEEIAAVILSAGLTLNKAENDQLLTAIMAIVTAAIPPAPADASETVKGILKIATTALAQALADDTTAITPKKLGDAFSAHALGRGQTWQNMTASRSAGVTYTNTSGRPIAISVTTTATTDTNGISLTLNGSFFQGSAVGGSVTGTKRFCSFSIIPPGTTYAITVLTGTVEVWMELRA